MNWEFNDKFEYRMFLAHTNTGGSLNSQTFNRDGSLLKPKDLTYGIFRATYGTVTDGIEIDMTVNLETQDSRAAFISDYAMRVHSLRVNLAALFKNFAIHGRFGVVHRLSLGDQLRVAAIDGSGIPPAPTSTQTSDADIAARAFTIDVPMNVFVSGFKTGKYLIKTSGGVANIDPEMNEDRPWGHADVAELYIILDNQPRKLTLAPVPGSVPTAWVAGQFLEIAGNRAITGGAFTWNPNGSWGGTGAYTSGRFAVTGAMEGLADLFPWHSELTSLGAITGSRLGMNLPFREQQNRLRFSTEQAGGFVYRRRGQSIINCILDAVALTTATVPAAEIGVWMNPDTMIALGMQETQEVRWIKDIAAASPLIFQRGVTTHTYTIGTRVIPSVISDYNIPTNIVIIGPKDDISYNAWDSSYAKIDDYIHETFAKTESPKPEDINIPNEFLTKLDFAGRIVYGSPVLQDGNIFTHAHGGGFVHPKNAMSMSLFEMGALFTEIPFSYTVVNLGGEIIRPEDVTEDAWDDLGAA